MKKTLLALAACRTVPACGPGRPRCLASL